MNQPVSQQSPAQTNGTSETVALPRDPIQLRIRSFEGQVLYFNGMYKLPVAPFPMASARYLKEPPASRLEGFIKTIKAEVSEGDDLLEQLRNNSFAEEPEYLAHLADWLGDMMIYCASEMIKHGLPVMEVLRIIMQSNFSKLQADGSVLYDENGKVLKGPGYWKPEPMLQALIEDAREAAGKEEGNKDASN